MTESLLIDVNVPLSQSCIWKAQRDFFEKKGIYAWQQVPYFVTSNTFIAEQYARLIFSYLQDICKRPAFHPDEPIYILELGAGSGLFSFYCNQALRKIIAQEPDFSGPQVCYIITDFTESNLNFWKTHPAFSNPLRQQEIDFSLFDLENPQPLFLVHRQEPCPAFKNPLILIGNYIFDSVKHDLFRSTQGIVKACHINTSIPKEDYDLEAKTLVNLKNIAFEHQFHAPQEKHYSEDIKPLLHFYREHFPEGDFSLPSTGIQCLNFFMKAAPSGFMLISSDKGYNTLQEIEKTHAKNLVFHGSFSCDVNFHALSQHIENKGGFSLMQSYREGIKTNVFFSQQAQPHQAIRTFQSTIEVLGPADYFRYHLHFKEQEKTDLSLMMSQLKLGQCDPYVFSLYITRIAAQIQTAPPALQQTYIKSIPSFFEHIYALPMGADHYFDLGFFMHTLSLYGEAIPYYESSLQHYGDRFDTLFNLGLCAYMCENYTQAKEYFEGAQIKNPDSPEVAPWLGKIQDLYRNHNETQ